MGGAMSPSRRFIKSTFAGVKIAGLLAAVVSIALAVSAAPLKTAANSSPLAEFTEPYETSGSSLLGSVLVTDPIGSEALALAEQDKSRVTLARGAYAMNFAVAALLRHHIQGAGGRYFVTRHDDRPSTASLDDIEARLNVIANAKPHCVFVLNHNPGWRNADRVILVPGEDQTTSDPVAVEVAQTVASLLEKHGFGQFHISVGRISAADRTGAMAIELYLPIPPSGRDWRPESAYAQRLAQALFEAWDTCWKSQVGDALRTRQQRVFRDSAREAQQEKVSVPEGVTTEVAKLARQLWPFPDSPRDAAQAEYVLNAYRRLLTDTTFFYLRTAVSRTPNGWRVNIRTNAKELGECAAGILRTLGCTPLEQSITVLPNRDALGGQLFGVTLQTAALTWGEPQEGKDVQTQLLPGEPVWFLDCTDDKLFYLVHGSDGYIGWVRADAIAPITESQFNELVSARTATLVAPWGNVMVALSPGTRLPILDSDRKQRTSDQSQSKDVTVSFPRKRDGGVEFETLTLPRDLLNLAPDLRRGQLAVEAALGLYGTPYVFGGRSANGLDCSGLVGACYQAAGLQLPRDARQMVIVGRLVATRWHRKTLLPGDILFFIDKTGKVIHTGLSLGGDRFIHSSPPCVRVNSFAPDDPLYSKTWSEAFIFARRPLD